MAERLTPYGLIVGLIVEEPQEKVEEKPQDAAPAEPQTKKAGRPKKST